MQAIQTKCKHNTNGNKTLSARAAAGSVQRVSWDDRLDLDGNHEAVCAKLCNKLGWTGTMSRGTLADGSYVHTFVVNADGKRA